ncbi:fimbrial protein [Haemophilus influenzae]|uniref:fimbrial protein n=1 Tax=Haemophilus influenzae TaxID=727 RepID=UPI0005AF3284|nr:fimbrial protein [Haemophilus influenzae]AXP61908.1 fimbrial protein [Haemophilus influenzae]KIP51026.1 pilus assembly protein PilC [Haemophilus influenzae]MCK9681541.1 fimbrial protein [Haemophilus influenzae]RFN98576.1 fimbrial protein [Haemophilus influenzae]
MKTLKSSPLHLSLLPYLMVLLFLFSAYPAMAAPNQAQGSDRIYGTKKYFTFKGSSDLVATSTQSSIIFFSRVRDNPKNNTFYSNNIAGGSISPFNSLTNWINTNITGDSGYGFRGLTCVNCAPIDLSLGFYLNQSKLTKTDQFSDSGDTIFRLKEHPELGVSFQLGTQHQAHNAYLPPLNFDNTGVAHIGGIQLYFGDSVSIVFRARLHLLENPSMNKTIPQIDLNLGYIKLLPLDTKPKNITFVIRDEGQINVRLKTPQVQLFEKIRECFVTSNAINPSSVTLKPVKKSEFDNKNEIEGGEFRLRVSCNKTENQINRQWLFPRVMITFKGEQDTVNDGSSDLLKTEKGNGQAKGVSLRIKRDSGNGDSVKYGQDSPQMANAGQFELKNQPTSAGGGQSADETFKVYYVKDPTRGTLTEGKVKAAATFTMSYQ